MAITDLDQLHPLHTFCTNCDEGESNGGPDNAVSPRDREPQERCNELPDGGACGLKIKNKDRKKSDIQRCLKQP